MEKAAKIVYDMETNRLTSNSKFIDARTASINSAIYFYGNNSNEAVQVTNAWYAVGVGEKYNYPIVGPSIVCNQSSSTFSINHLPPETTVSWTKSSNLSIVNETGSSYTVKAATPYTSGSGTVSATIHFSTGETKNISKTVWVGKAGQPTITPSGYPTIELNVSQYITIRAIKTPGYPTSFNWWVTGNPCGVDVVSGTTGTSCTFEAMESSWNNFYFNTTNVCGTSANAGGVIEVIEGGGGGMMKIYPNPATTDITVSISESLYDTEVMEDYELEVIDYNNNILIKEKGKEKEKRMNIGKLKFGIYTVRLKYKDKYYIERLLVQ